MAFATLGMPVASPAAAAERNAAELGSGVGRLHRSRSEPILLRHCFPRVSLAAASPRLGISRSVFPTPIRSLIFEPEDLGLADGEEGAEENISKTRRANWVQRICEIRSRWKDLQAEKGGYEAEGAAGWDEMDDDGCGVSHESEEEEEIKKREWDREEFAKFLNKASWTETKLFTQLAFLCNIAYVIPEIKVGKLTSPVLYVSRLSFCFLIY